MKYIILESQSIDGKKVSVNITNDDVNFVAFFADNENINYLNLLSQTGLSHKDFIAQTKNVWREV